MSWNPFLASVLAAWHPYQARLSRLNIQCTAHLNEERGTLGIEVEGPSAVGLIQAWEHASCLDFTYTRIPSLDSVLLFAGPCDTPNEPEDRLRKAFESMVTLHGGNAHEEPSL